MINIVRARLKTTGKVSEFISVKGRIKSLILKNKGDTFNFVIEDEGIKSVKEFGPDNINKDLVGKKVGIVDNVFVAVFNEDGTIDIEEGSTNESRIVKNFNDFNINI